MDSLDDLLIKRRRGLLHGAEEQRLRKAVRGSLEYELALLAGDVFEREGAARPGDHERLEQLARTVEQRWWSGARTRRRWPRALRPLVTVPIFLAGAAAASYGAYRAFGTVQPVASSPTLPVATAPAASSVPVASTPPAPAIAPLPPVVPPAMRPPTPTTPRSAPRASRSREREPDAADARSLAPTAPLASAPASAPRAAAEKPPAAELRPPSDPAPSDSAQALFRRANHLRHRDWSAAASVYRELVDRYPDSLEAGIAEMALGKWFLSQGRSGDALEWFRAHQRRPESALAAEALWGEARALESVGSRQAARAPWQRLLELHPSSPYAEIARQRLGH